MSVIELISLFTLLIEKNFFLSFFACHFPRECQASVGGILIKCFLLFGEVSLDIFGA